MLRSIPATLLSLLLVLTTLAGLAPAATTGPGATTPTLNLIANPDVAGVPAGTFTRATTATYVNKYGLIATAAAGAIRHDYDPVTLEYKGWLIEGARTNLIWPSEQFDNAAWTKTRASITANAAVAPDGTTTADKLVEDSTASTTHFLTYGYSTTNTTITLSVFVKASERSKLSFQISNNSTGAASATFDLSNGTISTAAANGGDFTATSASISSYGGGWYRCVLTTTKGNVNSAACPYFILHNGSSTTYTGDGSSGLYIWGAQFEAGAFPSSYIPTTTAAVTRAADSWTIPDVNLHGTEATLFADFDLVGLPVAGTYPSVIQLGAWGAGARWAMFGNGYDNKWYANYAYNSANVWSYGMGVVSAGTRYKVSMTFSPTELKACMSGGVVQKFSIASLNQPTPAICYIGYDSAVGFLFGHLRSASIYPVALSDAELQRITGSDPTHLTYPTLSLVSSPDAQPTIGTYTRNSTATYVDSAGQIQVAAAGVLRYDHDPVNLDANTGLHKGLGWLFEESRANLLTYSEQFDNGAWTKTRATVTANAAVAPDGNNTADKFVEDSTASSTHQLAIGISATSGIAHTFSVFIKAGERTQAHVFVDTGGGIYKGKLFNITSGTISNSVAGGVSQSDTSGMQYYGNGWWRCWVGFTTTSTSVFCAVRLYNAADAYTGDGSSGLYIWGAQLEAGSFPTSYIPTTTAAVTRAADVWNIPVTAFPFRADEGTLYAWVNPAVAYNTIYLPSLNNGSATDAVYLYSSSTPYLTGMVKASSTNQTAFGSLVFALGNTIKAALAYKYNDSALSMNGSTPTTDTSVTVPTITQLSVGLQPWGAGCAFHLIRLDYIPKRESNTDLQTRTTSALTVPELDRDYAMAA